MRTKQEQINEITELLKEYTRRKHICASVVILEEYAELIYNYGYRKAEDMQQ